MNSRTKKSTTRREEFKVQDKEKMEDFEMAFVSPVAFPKREGTTQAVYTD